MQNELLTIPMEEKKEIEKWVKKTYGSKENLPSNALSLILYKLHCLEEIIDRIEVQTKTHWAS